MEKMKQIGASTTGVKKQLVTWAKERGALAYAVRTRALQRQCRFRILSEKTNQAESANGDCELPFAFAVAQVCRNRV